MLDKLKENSRRLKLAALKNRIREGQKPAHQKLLRAQVRNEQKVPKIKRAQSEKKSRVASLDKMLESAN